MNSDFYFFFLLVRKPFSCSKWLTDYTIQMCGSQRVQSSAPCLQTQSFTDPALTLQRGHSGSQKDCSLLLLFWLAHLLAFLFHYCGLFDMYFSSPLSHKLDLMKFFGVWDLFPFLRSFCSYPCPEVTAFPYCCEEVPWKALWALQNKGRNRRIKHWFIKQQINWQYVVYILSPS